MRKNNSDAWIHRTLVTETLPYEVPVIFGNDKFYRAVTRKHAIDEVQRAIAKIHVKVKQYTRPYQYAIRKDSNRSTRLSIIHPLWQTEICDFYRSHEGSLLSHCAKSAFSLRRPVALASIYSEVPVDKNSAAPKTGLVESEFQEDNFDTSHFVSYFVYGKYNLLSKFYESPEFIRLEKRFRYMRTLDVSKCFYHIYTHSVSWAVKNKEYAKENSSAHSFEGRFDQLMQKANYNETNGIVVGPEISRIFAEIILQRVDANIERKLSAMDQMHNRNYSIRRYVDDYSVFGNTVETLNLVQEVIADELSEMKLYLNEKKIQTFERPFVTPLTLARTELGNTLKALNDLLSDDKRTRFLVVRDTLRDARANVVKHGIEFGNVSGWLLSTLNRLVIRAKPKLDTARSPEERQVWGQIILAILELAFHLCALDLRVRTTYNICQIINSIYKSKNKASEEEFHAIEHKLTEEMIFLIDGVDFDGRQEESVELYNLLITGVYFLAADFPKSKPVRGAIEKLLQGKVTYFKFITLTFCFAADSTFFAEQIGVLNKKVEAKLADGTDIRRDAEQFLLFADYLSSPLVDNKKKRDMFGSLLGGTLSSAAMEQLADTVGFVDWKNINVDHLLRRKELRPVYAMA